MAMARQQTEAPQEAVQEAQTEEQPEPVNTDQVVVEFVGGAHVRTISAADWRSVDVPEQSRTEWDRRDLATRGQAIVSARAAEYLTTVAGDKDDFRVVEPSNYSFHIKGRLGVS